MPYNRSSQHGGKGGSAFSDDLTEICHLVKVIIRHGSRIDAITSVWKMLDGREQSGPRRGGRGGSESSFVLGPDEFIVKVEGRSGSNIDRLIFHTNQNNTFGPYGGNGGNSFEVNGLKVVGFFGRSGSRIDALGFFSPETCQ